MAIISGPTPSIRLESCNFLASGTDHAAILFALQILLDTVTRAGQSCLSNFAGIP